jgi:hypothetical protein
MIIGQTVKMDKLNSEAAGKAVDPCEEVLHTPETMFLSDGSSRVERRPPNFRQDERPQ